MKPALLAGACALFLLAACAPTRRHGEPAPSPSTGAFDSLPAEVRTIFLVHGDAEYTWHDSTGKRHRADRDAFQQALETAALPRGEVFLFHLRRGSRGWFKGFDGSWEHYRGGSRVSGGTYVRTEKDTAFEAEAAILRRSGKAPSITRLAYFGHELPLTDQPGYFRRRPGRPFSQRRFAQALGALQPADTGKPYETIVLSMCYGANPALVADLRPLSRLLVASPAYLHLSYLDARALGEAGISHPADTVVARSFARLSAHVTTEITVGVYDLESVRPPAVPARASAGRPAWKDCAEAPGFDRASAAAGTRLFYRPPRFGAGRDKAARSAWQCAF